MQCYSFKGRVAVITGAGRGIGRAYALALAEHGAKVVVNDLGTDLEGRGEDKGPADAVVDEIRAGGGEAVANWDTVATMAGGRNIIRCAVDTFGGIDILINNAGILRDRSFLKMSEEEWDQVIAVHLKGAFAVTQPALKVMTANNYGRIVFTASSTGLFGNFGQTNYGAAKLGVVGLMNSLKIELAQYNIKMNTVAPTADTRMTTGVFTDEVKAKVKLKFNIPLVLYLASEENQHTGLIFSMKCGWFARTAITCGRGIYLGDFERDILVEEVGRHFNDIFDIEGAEELQNGAETFRLVEAAKR